MVDYSPFLRCCVFQLAGKFGIFLKFDRVELRLFQVQFLSLLQDVVKMPTFENEIKASTLFMVLSNKLRAVNVQLDLKQICFALSSSDATCSLLRHTRHRYILWMKNFHWFSNNSPALSLCRGRGSSSSEKKCIIKVLDLNKRVQTRRVLD